MADRYAILGVEGHHDQAFVSKILQLMGFQEFKGKKSKLAPFWFQFIPTYPKKQLYVRVDMPSILFADDLSVAVYAGEGTNLKSRFPVLLRNHLPYHQDISGFGIIADADEKEPRAVVQEYHKAFEILFPDFPLKPGVADSDSLRTGIFVLPNNRDRGVLETRISECGAMIYPRFMMLAKNFVAQFDEEDTSHWKPFDRDKAIIAAAASILQPGKTNTVTIKKDQWIQKETFSVISDIVTFLKDLLKLR